MKRILSIALAVLLTAALTIPAAGQYSPDADYMAQMLAAVCSGDYAAGSEAAAHRAEKLEALALGYPPVDFEELWLLSKIICAEASPEFPDTMLEVLEQPGQYYGKNSVYFDRLKPSAACAEAARRLLEGERVLHAPSVVFQSNYVLGSGIFLELKDSLLGSTYLCFSSHPELYET